MGNEKMFESLEASLARSKPERLFTDVEIVSDETAEEAGGQGSYVLYGMQVSEQDT